MKISLLDLHDFDHDGYEDTLVVCDIRSNESAIYKAVTLSALRVTVRIFRPAAMIVS